MGGKEAVEDQKGSPTALYTALYTATNTSTQPMCFFYVEFAFFTDLFNKCSLLIGCCIQCCMQSCRRSFLVEDGMLEGQAEVWKLIYGYAESMAVKCAVELGVPDIIHSHGGGPISLSQIASELKSSSQGSIDVSHLSRLMRYLAHKSFFSATTTASTSAGETLYGLTTCSKWLVKDSEMSLAPMLLWETDPVSVDPFTQMSCAIRNGGGSAFQALNQGRTVFEVASANPRFNTLFNDGMACTSRVVAQAILSAYAHGFGGIRTLVDVGGGTGYLVSEIVNALSPHIQGINFDLPHVVSDKPTTNPGVTHVGGSMFDSVPCADAVIMKWVLHDFGDEDCLKILRNCRKAIPAKGKIFLVETVLQPQTEGLFDDTAFALDLVMMVKCPGGKERTQTEWTHLLQQAGFSQCSFIKTPSLSYLIEAYPS